MATLEDLYAVSRRLCFDVQEGLGRLERNQASGGQQRNERLARDTRTRLGELKKITNEMERRWRDMAMTASISKSDTWKVRRRERETAHSWCPPEMNDECRSDWKRA